MNDELTPVELNAILDSVMLIDVREPHEYNAGHLENATLIPLQTIPRAIENIPRDTDIVLYCRMGGRSGRALDFFRQQGFTRVSHLRGGLQAWKRDIDPSLNVV